MDLRDYQTPLDSYDRLSLQDLLEARDLYHLHLMGYPNVVATAVGRYRIRRDDDWPRGGNFGRRHGTYPRTLANSEVRPYSWPCLLVFVDKWVEEQMFSSSSREDDYKPDQIVPKTLYVPDGRRIPVCVILAPRQGRTIAAPPKVRYPLNNIGGGYPVIADVQGERHVATVACLVNDGHRAYALTNRHVAGDPGEVLYSELGGKYARIGVSSSKQLSRMRFCEAYEGWPGKKVYVNLDVGLIDVDDLSLWSARVLNGEGSDYELGPLADLSTSNMSLSLIGCLVTGYGAASRRMLGEIHALFYRYKQQGGFEYVADFLIGPRTPEKGKRGKLSVFSTRPGDSGTLWLLEPRPNESEKKKDKKPELLPLAVQWGANVLRANGSNDTQPYALATCLSTVCAQLGVDPVRDWNLDQPDTWGAVGHFSIASRTSSALSRRFPRLSQLMEKNLEIISHDDETILKSDFKGMGSESFVALADVPDFFWKHGKQGASRGMEGPNHFADMDQPGPGGQDLLDLCTKDANIDPGVWDSFYDSVHDLLTGDPIEQKHRGLLPFRVWQIFDAMVEFASKGKGEEFVCAAGVLTHYVGDACQPLHISYLHDGDPERGSERTVHHRDGTTGTVKDPLAKGVHSAYEDDMVNASRRDILTGLGQTPKTTRSEAVKSGFEAAKRTISLMRSTFRRIPPPTIVDAYVNFQGTRSARAKAFWKLFGPKTIACMKDGTHLLAVLWESAWDLGDGESEVRLARALTEEEAMDVCADRAFLPSCSIAEIGPHLNHPGA